MHMTELFKRLRFCPFQCHWWWWWWFDV